nr:odorant receptor 6 [Achelura yunnanensis]
MVTKFFKSLEDPKRPLLDYWILYKMGLLLPNSKLKKIIFIIIHELATFFVLSQFMELYVIRSDFDEVLTNLRISMLSIVCVVKANTFLLSQSKWKQVLHYVTTADLFERNNRVPDKKNTLDTCTKYCRSVTFYYWVLVFFTVVATIFTPLGRFLSSSNFREEFRNGTELFPHIFSSWMPLDKYHSPGSWITVVWHLLVCAYGSTVMAAYDTTAIILMEFFGMKLELLRARCELIFGTDETGISDDEATNLVRQLHTIHVQLLKHSRLLNSLLSPVMFVYVFMCTFMLCTSAFQLTTATSNTQKFIMAEYLIFGVAQLFMFCWHSNKVLVKSHEVILGPYESKWWAAGLKQRKLILMLTGQLQVVQIYSAGPFTDLTVSTFIGILKGAYSYYTLLRK